MKSSGDLPYIKKKLVLFDIDHTLFDTDTFKRSSLVKYKIFNDVESTLRELSELAVLGIFSEGDNILQMSKLKKTGIVEFFLKKHIHIFKKKEENLQKLLSNYKDELVYLVDDRLPILHSASVVNPSLFTIWMKRGPYALSQENIGYKPKKIIENLEEIISIISEF